MSLRQTWDSNSTRVKFQTAVFPSDLIHFYISLAEHSRKPRFFSRSQHIDLVHSSQSVHLIVVHKFNIAAFHSSQTHKANQTTTMCHSYVSPKPSSAPASGDCGSSSSTDNNEDTTKKYVAQHLTLLHDVIKSQRWSAFENIVLSNPSIFRAVSDAMPKCDEFDGMSLLHATLRY